MSEDEERLLRPDGHRYEAPESEEEIRSKGWGIGALALLVVLMMVLIATGTVQVFDY